MERTGDEDLELMDPWYWELLVCLRLVTFGFRGRLLSLVASPGLRFVPLAQW